jgi:hypothetical protein
MKPKTFMGWKKILGINSLRANNWKCMLRTV